MTGGNWGEEGPFLFASSPPPPHPFPPFRVPFTFASPPLSENRLEIRVFSFSPIFSWDTIANKGVLLFDVQFASGSCSQMSRPQSEWWSVRKRMGAGGQNKDKSSNSGLRGSQNGGQTWSYTRLLYFLLNQAFLSVLRSNSAWTEVSHIFRNIFLEKYST